MNKDVTERQLQILEYIVDIFVSTGNPVASKELLSRYNLDISSATIRNEMAALEELGLLEKPHTSGGRVPTSLGYEVYVNTIKDSKTNVSKIKRQIKEIFKNRDNSIEEVIDQALHLIDTSMHTVVLSKKELDSVTLKDINAYKLDSRNVMIIAVFSNGTINKIEQPLDDLKFEDVETAINIFSERLRDTKASELQEKALDLREIIEDKVKDLEDKFQEFVRTMFNSLLATRYEHTDTGSLVTRNQIDEETLEKLLESIKDESIWEMMAKSKSVDARNTAIAVDLKETGLKQISAIKKDFNVNGEKREIALIGPSWTNYKEIIEVLEVVEEQLDKMNDK